MPKFVDGESGASVRAKLNTVIDKVEGVTAIGNDITITGNLTVDTNTLHVDSATNRVGIGTASPTRSLHLQLASTDINPGFFRVQDSTAGMSLQLGRARGTGEGSETALQSGDRVGGINSAVYDGTSYVNGARINTIVDGIVSTGSVPTAIVFDTHNGTSIGERMRLTSSGNVGIGTSSPGSKLSVVGLPTTQTGLADGDIWLDSGALRTGSPDDAIILTPESYGADATAASNASTVIATFLGKCLSEEKMGLMAGQYRLDSAITFSMDGTAPGEHISLLGAGQNMRGIQVNNSTGGIHFQGINASRQHTVELRSLQFEPSTADSGYPFKVTGIGGGVSSQSAVIIDGVYVGARDEGADLDFNVGPSITGLYRPRINDLRIVQPIDASAVNKWAHCLDLSDTYFPVVNDLWINVAQTTGGADIGIDFSGTTQEAGYFSNCVINGPDVGFYMERTGREPHFQWYGGHINCKEVGMQLNGVKYALIDGVLMYSNNVPALTDYVDFLVEDADGVVFRNCQFRTDGGDKRHWKLEPKSGKTGAVVRNITIYLDQASLFADTAVAPIYCNGATNVTIVLPDEVSSSDFTSYPEKLVEMGPSQDVSEVRIITQSGLRKFDDTNALGPDFILDRVSASPANSDGLGRFVFTGRNSADEVVEYANILSRILTVTDGTEAGYVDVNTKYNGADLNVARFIRPALNGSTGLQIAAREGGVTTLEGVQWVDATVNGQAGRFLFLPT